MCINKNNHFKWLHIFKGYEINYVTANILYCVAKQVLLQNSQVIMKFNVLSNSQNCSLFVITKDGKNTQCPKNQKTHHSILVGKENLLKVLCRFFLNWSCILNFSTGTIEEREVYSFLHDWNIHSIGSFVFRLILFLPLSKNIPRSMHQAKLFIIAKCSRFNLFG